MENFMKHLKNILKSSDFVPLAQPHIARYTSQFVFYKQLACYKGYPVTVTWAFERTEWARIVAELDEGRLDWGNSLLIITADSIKATRVTGLQAF